MEAEVKVPRFERWERAMALGDFERAWIESDACAPSCPRLHELQGRRVLVRCLRGLGDAIQFLRYAPALKAACGSLTIQAPDGLLPWVSLIPGIDHALPLEARLPGRDFEIECSDMPYFFRTTVATIPPPAPIALPDVPISNRLLSQLQTSDLKIGIAWSAGSWNPTRSIPFGLMLPWAQIPRVALFSLQRGPAQVDLRRPCTAPIIDAELGAQNILHTAVVIARLDLVITVDTMIAHLAGSLGKPVWILLPEPADWRWMLRRSDSPWYPCARLFRQETPGDWSGLAETVGSSLAASAAASAATATRVNLVEPAY